MNKEQTSYLEDNPLQNKEECFARLRLSPLENIAQEKNRLNQVAYYYAQNFNNFSPEEAKEIWGHPHLPKIIKAIFFHKMVSKAIKQQIVLPDELIDEVTIERIQTVPRQRYLCLLEAKESPQINKFLLRDSKQIISEFIKSAELNRPQSKLVANFVMKQAPESWAYNMVWSKDELKSYLESTPKLLEKYITAYHKNSPRLKDCETIIWDILVKNIKAKPLADSKEIFSALLAKGQHQFLEHIKNIYPDFFAKAMKKNNLSLFHEYYRSLFEIDDAENNFNHALNLLQEFRHEIAKPVIDRVGGIYEEEISAFRHGLRDKSNLVFYMWSNHIHELTFEDKRYFAAACLNAMINNKACHTWMKKTLTLMDVEILQEFKEKARSKMEIAMPENFKMLETIINKRLLDETLPVPIAQHQAKKLKV